MRKLLFLFAALGLLFVSCTDDLENDLNDLKDRVSELETADIADMTFDGTDLIITFGDGTTSTATVPDAIFPNNVSDFDIDNATGVITVTFYDGTTAEYRLVTNGGSTFLSGTLTGEYGISSITLGDVKLAEMAYDDQNRLIQALINMPNYNGGVVNVMELQNNYADVQPTMMAIEKAMYNDYDYDYLTGMYTSVVYFPGDSGSYFTRLQEDGELYTYYSNRFYDGMNYRYDSTGYCWFVAEDDINYDAYPQFYPVPGEDSTFFKSYNNYYWTTIDGEWGRLYRPAEKIKITQIYQPGETMDTTWTRLTMRTNDLIEKVEMMNWEDEVMEYYEMTYDENDLLTQIDMFDIYDNDKKISFPETDTAHYARLVMTYNGEDLLEKVVLEELDEVEVLLKGEVEVTDTYDVVSFVYDDAGNPTEVWVVPGYMEGDYIFTTDQDGKIIITAREMELIKMVEIEYDYTLPNFFGETLENLIPELKGLTIKNAPTRLLHSGFFDFVNMEYYDFNAGGYPAKVKVDAHIGSFYGPRKASYSPFEAFLGVPMQTELMMEYTELD